MSDNYEYCVLTSNDSKTIYPDNTMSNFRVKLGWRMERKGTWECALVRLSYTNTISTFNQVEKVYIKEKGANSGSETSIYPEHYQTIGHLIRTINETVRRQVNVGESDRLPVIGQDKYGRVHKFEGMINNKAHEISFSEGLDLILGFGRNGFHYLDAFRNDIYVYIDCIKKSVVGDQYVPLLATVDISAPHARYGDQVIVNINKPEYVPLSHSDISELEVQILDDTGHEVKFGYGTLTVTIHFRER